MPVEPVREGEPLDGLATEVLTCHLAPPMRH